MKSWLAMTVVGLTLLSFAGTAQAKEKWHRVADLKAGGDAKEVAVNRQISTVLIRCTEGTVIINTIVIRDGGNKAPFPVTARINQGEDKTIEVGNERNCSGIRISDDGKGSYVVFVR